LALTDETGVVTDQYTYSPYGQVLLHSGTTDTPYQLAGRTHVRNEGNGLYSSDVLQQEAQWSSVHLYKNRMLLTGNSIRVSFNT
jgi:hypothetical protein